MTDDMCCPKPEGPASAASEAKGAVSPDEKECQLPTLQRNALCKLFDRHYFSPEEVASLGYRRLLQAPGIGHKGISAITAWLANHGYELKPPPAEPKRPVGGRKQRRSIEQAVRLLRVNGYVVIRQGAESGDPDNLGAGR